jgi:amino acid transporter
MDHKTRGFGLGGPAMVLPLIAYFISRNDSSKGLGGMILVAGILIIIGAVTVIGMTDFSEADETARNPLMEIAPLLIVGGIQMGLGVLKIKKS